MNLFLKKIFGLVSRQEPAGGANSSRGFYSSVQGGSESSVRAELVHVVMRDLLRKSGIPPGWISCQPQVLQSRSKGPGIFVRLSVKHWDDRLMQYAFAFQKALLTDIVRFEPKAATWLHGIAWQLEVASTCPHTKLPDKDFWLEAPAASGFVPAPDMSEPTTQAIRPLAGAPTAAKPTVVSTPSAPIASQRLAHEAQQSSPDIGGYVAEDLEHLFAARDKGLAWPATNIMQPSSYQKTEPAPLQGQ